MKKLFPFVLALFFFSCRDDSVPNFNSNTQTIWNINNVFAANNFKSIAFTSANTGYIAGNSFPNDSTKLLKTIDGGLNWSRVLMPSGSSDIVSMDWLDDNNGYLIGGFNKIYKTTNGGTSFTEQIPNATPLRDIDFFDAGHGYGVGYSNTIVRTNNGGLVWDSLSSTVSDSINYYSVKTFSWNDAIACGDSGKIVRIFNSTQTDTATSNTTNGLNSIYFVNVSVGYCVGQNATVLRTLNGGATWLRSFLTIGNHFNDVVFINESTGYCVGENGIILKTSNSVSTWSVEASHTSDYLRSIIIFGDKGWIVGESGTVLSGQIR